ncbi:MAG: hypothetical protein QM702_07685 [Rubrivivax sp.]
MSSKRRIRRRSCTGKQRFDDVDAAQRAISSLIRRRGPQGGWLQPYHCQFCRGVHFGHAPRRPNRSR